MRLQQDIKLNVGTKLILAAMTLMLPLVVFVVILVNDRNEQIRTTESEIVGVEHLVELREILELIPRHRALVQLPGAAGDNGADTITGIELRIDTALAALQEHTVKGGDPFRIGEPLDRIVEKWNVAKRNPVNSSEAGKTDREIVDDLVVLFRQLGNKSKLAIDSSIETTHLIDLIVIELPQMVARISESRSRAIDILERGGGLTQADRNQLSVDDWALQLAHDNLFYGYNIAVEEDPEIAENLARQFEIFDRDTHAFHRLVATAEFGDSPEQILALGTSSIDATLRLFDRVTPELERLLVNHLESLRRIRLIAILSVIAASLVAGISGWLLLRAMTGPLQTEIAERRRVQARLRDLAAIVEQSEDSILTLSPDGKITSWNAGAERLYGYPADEVIGRDINLLAPDGFESETGQLLQQSIAGNPLPTHETIRVRKDGELVEVSLRFSTIRSPDGEVRGGAIIARDIGERKKAEAELHSKERMLQSRVDQLRRTQDELQRHRDRLEDLVRERTEEVHEKAAQLEIALRNEKEYSALQRKFVSMASHEFRTPLAIIDGAAQRLERNMDAIDPEDLSKRISRIRGAVTRMLGLIDSTLSASRLDEGRVEINWQPVDLGTLVRTVCERQGELTEKLTLDISLDDLPADIDGDPALLDQVFTNLLSNAAKYSPEDPRIRVHGKSNTDGSVSVSVRDNGIGIPADELPKIFDRFFRASTSEGIAGTGIGLQLAHELIEMHRGSITVDSELDQGTIFTVRLPMHRADEITVDDMADTTDAAA